LQLLLAAHRAGREERNGLTHRSRSASEGAIRGRFFADAFTGIPALMRSSGA
jgi:hypothetical protein